MKTKYSYQPDGPTSVICWSFTGMIFLLSMLLWLEITVLQIWTIITFVIFVLVVVLQLQMRKLVFAPEQLQITKVIKINNEMVSYADLVAVRAYGHKLVLKTDKHKYELLLKKGELAEVLQQLKERSAQL